MSMRIHNGLELLRGWPYGAALNATTPNAYEVTSSPRQGDSSGSKNKKMLTASLQTTPQKRTKTS